jgi:hypothetical protein
MHAAPSVSYPVGRSRFAAALHGGLALLGLVGAAAFALQSAQFGWRQGLVIALAAACGALAALGWLRSPPGVLHWNGLAWEWEESAAVATGQPSIALDLQSRLLLRWHAAGGAHRWLWLQQESVPADWEALRRAVYSRATPPAPAAGEQPPAAEQ